MNDLVLTSNQLSDISHFYKSIDYSFHPEDINYNMEVRKCCGKPMNSPPCKKCHHVMSAFDLRVYFEMKKELTLQ